MSIIKKLDEHTTNLIAAGEVIERAASVVKELVENAIDAQATNIKIILIDSGINEIRVIDDGIGMDAVDAKMCVIPHATSKIKDSQDLFRIQSLGFRGEALASIVAVSNFRLITSQDGAKATMYSLKGGIPTSEAIVAHPKGTEVIVRGLFFNTPARLQSMQSQGVELSHITDYITKMALAMPGVAFTLINNDKVILQTYGSNNVLEVISVTMGNEIAKSMIKVFDYDGIFKIYGYTSNLSVTRSKRDYLHILVNGRAIRNNVLTNAIIKGYETLLMTGKYPITILNIEVDPGMVDVNVHPSKIEVRFSEETRLSDLITKMIAHTLAHTNLSLEIQTSQAESDSALFNEGIEKNEKEEGDDIFRDENESEQTEYVFTNQEEDQKSNENEFENYETQTNNLDQTIYHQQQYSLQGNDEIINAASSTKVLEKLYYIGQLFGTYLLAQNENNFYLIDQHAAAERINYEKIIQELEKSEQIGYDLLIPFSLEFSVSDFYMIQENANKINNLGIDFEEFGSNTIIVRRIPIWIFRGREKEFVEEIITKIIQNKKMTKTDFLDSLAKNLACKKSIKGNEYHSALEIEYMLDDLGKTKNPFTCPHGRPVIVKIAKAEIEKWFKRLL